MIVLHAGIRDGRLQIWGETPAESAAVPAKRRGRTSARRKLELPYAASGERLLEALAEGAGLSLSQGIVQTAVAWLPTINGRPIASSPIIAEITESDGETKVVPWEVPALSLPA